MADRNFANHGGEALDLGDDFSDEDPDNEEDDENLEQEEEDDEELESMNA